MAERASILEKLRALPVRKSGGTVRWRDRLPENLQPEYDKVLADLKSMPRHQWPDRKELMAFIVAEFGQPITINTLLKDVERG